MLKIVKFFSVLFAIVLLLVIVIIVAAMLLIKPNDYKQKISQQISAKIQREFIIRGDLSWTFFPMLGIQAHDMSLSNAAALDEQDFANIKQMTLSVKLLPLFYQHLEINKLELEELTLHLLKDKAGNSNWQDLLAIQQHSDQKIAAIEDTKNQQADLQLNLNISEINIKDAKIIWADQQQKQQAIFDEFNVQLKHIALDKAFPVRVTGFYSDNQKIKKLPIGFNAMILINLKKSNFSLTNVEGKLANLQWLGNIVAKNFTNNLMLDGNISIPQFSLRDFLQAMGAPLMQNKHALQKVSSQFVIKKNKQGLKLTELKCQLDTTQIAGNISIQGNQQKTIFAQLSLDKIDLGDYLASNSDNKPQIARIKMAEYSGTITAPEKIGYTLVQRLIMNGKFEVQELQLGQVHLTKLRTVIKADQGLIKLMPVTANLYQGKYRGNISFNFLNAKPSFVADQTLSAIDMAALLADFKDITHVQLTGIGDLHTQITAVGDDAASIVKTLAGKAQFKINNGILKGINLDYWLEVGSAIFHQQAMPNNNVVSETSFRNLTGSFIIDQGIARNDDFLMQSNLLRVDGQGKVNLVTKQLDYLFNAVKINPANNQSRNDIIPIRVTGSFGNLSIRPDVEQLIRNQAKKEIQNQAQKLQEKVGEQVDKQLGKKVGDQIRNLNLDKLFNR